MLLKTENIRKTYVSGNVKTEVLKGIDLQVEVGEFIALMGHSGSGKSTLMHILGMLDQQTSGTYIFDGKDTAKYSDDELADIRNKKIGFVFQSFNLLPKTSAIDNVRLPMVYAGIEKEKQTKRAKNLLKKVGLSHREDNLSNELSGGEKQRVAIARALVNTPALILADEPTGNLDSTSSREVMEIFKQLHEEGHTILIVTHEDNIAQYAKRTIRMRDGVIIGHQKDHPHK